jgi:predicted acyltransferase
MNAIFIYMFTSLVHVGPIVDVFIMDIVQVFPKAGLLLQQLAILLVEWLMLFWMYKRSIFVKA